MKTLITIGFVLTLSFNVLAQHDIGSGNLNNCVADLRDSGGNSNYGDNQDIVETYCSNVGDCIRVNFSSFNKPSAIE